MWGKGRADGPAGGVHTGRYAWGDSEGRSACDGGGEADHQAAVLGLMGIALHGCGAP